MKIFNIQFNKVFDVDFKKDGENKIPCPNCSETRRNKKDPCLGFNTISGVGFCHHCDSRYVTYKPHEKIEYKKPEWINYTDLSDNQVKWFSNRMISQNTLIKMKVSNRLEYMPQVQEKRNCISFPFFRGEELVNVKFRDGAKNFKLEQGAELIWYNYNALTQFKEIVITEGECFTGDTEILTKNGWVKFHDYKGGEVAQFKEDESIEFVNPICRIEKEYNGNLVDLSVKGYSSLTTENHNILVRTSKGDYKKVTANYLFEKKQNLSLIRVGKTTSSGIQLTDDQIRFCVAVSADFCIRKTGDIYGAFKKDRKVERITALLNNLGLRYTKTKVSKGYTSIFIHRGQGLEYATKMFNHSWLGELSLNQCKIIIEELLFWDGNSVPNRNQIEYSSKHLENSIFIQTVSHLCGYCSSIMKRKNEFGEWYKVSILFSKKYSNTQHLKKEKIKYEGKVYCVQVPSGAILVRHNNKISVSGNCDALSFIEDGIENVISVPNGASIGRMDYLDSSIELFENIEKVYIAVDCDEKGILLRDELVRRIGSEKCFICNFSEFKDANEYLCHKGRESLVEVIKNAKEIEVDGVVRLETKLPDIENLYHNGVQRGAGINESEFDDFISWELGRLAIFTGVPGSGKSEVVDFITTKLSLVHGWKACYWSPENYPLQYHYSKISEKIIGKKFNSEEISSDEFWNAYEFIKKNFFWIDPEEPYLDNILNCFKFFIKKHGIKICVLDPFSNIYDEIDYKKQGKMLTKISMFARQNNVLFILLAHPRKLEKDKDGHFPMPTMYDISGSADFWNRADYGVAVRRNQNTETNAFENSGQIAFHKIKYKHLGKQGVIDFVYNYKNGRYILNGASIDNWDYRNWLVEEPTELKANSLIDYSISPKDAFDECPF